MPGRRPHCHQARACKSHAGTVLLLGCGKGSPGWHRKQLCRVCTEWGWGNRSTEQRICNGKCSVGALPPCSPAPSSLMRHTLPPSRERSVESREGGARKCRISGHSAFTCTVPQAHRCICCQRGQYFYANPAYRKHTPSPTLVLPSEPRCSHTHVCPHTHTYSYSCFYGVTHTTLPKSNNQQRVSDCLLCSSSCPLRFLA